MLKQPDKFLPVTADPSFHALVSSGLNGDFRVRDIATGELYLNFFAMGQSFFHVAEHDVFSGPNRLERVEDKALAKKLIKNEIRIYRPLPRTLGTTPIPPPASPGRLNRRNTHRI